MALSFFRKKLESSPQKTNHSPITYQAFAATDIGVIRDSNEDQVLFTKPNDTKLLKTKGVLGIVADGMGGHNYGDVASRMAVEIVTRVYFDQKNNIGQALNKALITANEKIYKEGEKNSSMSGMGTTCTAVVIKERDLYISHVGDSRAYHIQGRQIDKLTKDHTYVQHLLDHDVINAAQAHNHPERNVILKSLGPNPRVSPDNLKFKNLVKEDDLIMLCSDGLYEYLSESEMAEMLASQDKMQACMDMIEVVKKRGGHDNITIMVIHQSTKPSIKIETKTQEISE